MDTRTFAQLLHGREYGREITKDEELEAKEAGLVAVFGYSDDGVVFRGAIKDSLGSYEGRTVYLTDQGLMKNRCKDERCPHFAATAVGSMTIEALWCAGPDYSWTYKTDVQHETFDIIEDGDLYCRGIVFSLASVAARMTATPA